MSGLSRRAVRTFIAVVALVVAVFVGVGLSGRKPPGPAPIPAAAAGSKAVVSGRVELDPALHDRLSPGASLVIYAYAVDGPRVPLAVRRHVAAELPLEFTLDDGAAVNPAFRISMAPQVLVGARLRMGDPSEVAAPGDLFGSSGPVPLGTRDLRIVIDKRVPGGKS
jgi:cytochrome c-type biogenesis protein CcmH